MGNLKSPAVIDILVEGLKHADAQTAMGIGLSLGKIGEPGGIPALMSLFDREDALETLATNPVNETLASVAHWSLMWITSSGKDVGVLRREGLGMIPGDTGSAIKDRAALTAVRNAWRAKLATPATPPATQPGMSR